MAYGVVFILLGAAMAVQGLMLGGWGLLLLWPAVSFAAVGAGYLVVGPRVMGKRADGRLSVVAVVALLPFFLFTWGVWHAGRITSRKRPAACEVAPGVWLGRRVGVKEMPGGVTIVVDLTAEFWEPAAVRAGRTYLCLPTLDATASDEPTFREAIDRVVAAPGSIYIHCAQGMGRSAAFAAAILIRKGAAADVDEAVALLAKARPGVRRSARQRDLVRRVADVGA